MGWQGRECPKDTIQSVTEGLEESLGCWKDTAMKLLSVNGARVLAQAKCRFEDI